MGSVFQMLMRQIALHLNDISVSGTASGGCLVTPKTFTASRVDLSTRTIGSLASDRITSGRTLSASDAVGIERCRHRTLSHDSPVARRAQRIGVIKNGQISMETRPYAARPADDAGHPESALLPSTCGNSS